MNNMVMGNMIPDKDGVINIEVLALSQELNLEVIPKYLQRADL